MSAFGGKAVVLRRGRRCRDGWKPPHIHICSVGRRELGVWDLSHSLSGTSLVGLSITEIPLNYGIFCSTYDFVVACYLIISATAWHEPGRFDLYFWRHRHLGECFHRLISCALAGRVPFSPHAEPLGRPATVSQFFACCRRFDIGDFQGGQDETPSISHRSWRRRRRRHDRQAGDRTIQPDHQMAIDGELAKIPRHALRRL